MFRGKSTSLTESYPITYDQYFHKKDILEPLHPTISNHEYSHPTVDRLHFPELMRSQTEESRSAMHSGKNHLRVKTLSSLYLSTRPRDMSYKENLAFSRRIANRLDSSNTNRPESVHGLVSIFSRNTWREKKERLVGHVSRASASNITTKDENLMAKSYDSEFSNSCNSISIPYNFRHLGHTQCEKITNISQRAQSELASDNDIPNSLRNRIELERQALRVDDLHFENFSSEALGTQICDERRPISAVDKFRARQRTVLHKKRMPSESKFLSQASLYNETRIPQHQIQMPPSLQPYLMESMLARNSSWTPSNADLASSSTPERSCTKSDRDNSFSSEISTAKSAKSALSETIATNQHQKPVFDGYSLSKYHENLVRAGEDSWPLPNSTNSSCFMVELPDVEEEEEDLLVAERRVISSVKNRDSFEFDEKMLGSIDDIEIMSESGSPAEWDPLQTKRNSSIGESHSVCSDLEIGSWESDIDWCYENEVEADCDYRWIEEGIKEPQYEASKTHRAIQAPQLMLQVNEPMNMKNFRLSLLLPEKVNSSGLSSVSTGYMSSPTSETPVHIRRDCYVSITPKVSSPDEPAHLDGFQTEVTTCDFQTQLQHETNSKETFVGDYFTVIPSPVSENSSISLFGEGISKNLDDRSWPCSQNSSNASLKSSANSYSNINFIDGQENRKHKNSSSMTSLLDRRNETPYFDTKLPSILSPISYLDESKLFESLKTEDIQRGRPAARPVPDRNLSAPSLGQSTNKSRSSSQKSSNLRLKCSYGLFPQV